jgi:TRAP-type C4-dicarboxylate transport system substrate-binding protein
MGKRRSIHLGKRLYVKNLFRLGILCVTVFFFVLALEKFPTRALAEEPIVLKGVTGLPRPVPFNSDVPTFIKMVEERSKGRLKIQWMGGPEVIKTFDQADALRKGIIDVLLYHPRAYFKPLMPSAIAGSLSPYPAWEERKVGLFDLWHKIFREEVNAEYLGRMHSKVNFRIYTNAKIEKIEDFKGKRFRTMPLYIPFFKALGISAVTMPPPEVYTAMERGVVDGFMWPELGIVALGWNEVTKYAIDPPVPFQIEPATVVNLDKFNSLPKDLQALLKDTFKDLEYIASDNLLKKIDAEWRIAQKSGMRRIELPSADAKKYQTIAIEETWKEVLKDAPKYGPEMKKLCVK